MGCFDFEWELSAFRYNLFHTNFIVQSFLCFEQKFDHQSKNSISSFPNNITVFSVHSNTIRFIVTKQIFNAISSKPLLFRNALIFVYCIVPNNVP